MAEEDDKRPESGALKGARAGQRRRVPPTIDLAPSEVTPVAEPRGSLADEPLDPASEMPLDAALPPEPSDAEPSGAEPSRAEPSAPSSSFDTPASPANGSRMTDTDRAPSTSPPSGGIGSAFPVAILGALAGLILVFFAAALGLLPINDRRAAESLERVTALQQSVASLRSSQAASDLGPLTQRVADLESASAALGPVQDRLAALDQQLQALAGSVPPDLAAHISTLAADLGALREEVAAASTVNPDSPLAVAGTVTDLQSRLAAAEERLTALDPARLDALTAELGDLSRQLSAIDQRLVRVEAAPSVAEEARRTAEIMAVGVLRGAASRGEPFKAELDLVDALGVDHPALAELAPLAETGTPTAEALSASFQPAVMDQILAATEAIPPDANFLDRMVGGVRSLVSVRPAGPIEGTTPVAIVSRIRAALQAGDLAAAAAEWDSLPEAGKAPSAGWAAQLKARIAVDAALNDLAAALAPAPPDTPALPNAPPG